MFCSYFVTTFSEAPLVSKSGIDLAPPFPKVDLAPPSAKHPWFLTVDLGFCSTFSKVDLAPPFPKVDKGG